MKQVNIKSNKRAPDSDGRLYDPQVRDSLSRFALDGDTRSLEVASAIRSAAHALEGLKARGAGSGGISAGAMDILLRLSLGTDLAVSLTELAKALGVSARNITGLIDTLEQSGLVERTPDFNDRRSVLARITVAGVEKVETLRKPTQLAMNALFQGFDSSELTLFRDLCLRLVENAEHLNP